MTIALYITLGIAAINMAVVAWGWKLAHHRRGLHLPAQPVLRSLAARYAAGAK